MENFAGDSIPATCNEIDGQATSSSKTASSLTVTNITYTGCTANGSPATVTMNSCDYHFSAGGGVEVKCPPRGAIKITIPTCVYEIGSQTLSGVSFHNIGSEGAGTTEVTASTHVTNISGTVSGVGCGMASGFFSKAAT